MKIMKCGLITLGCLAFSFGQANAATTFIAQTKATGGALSLDIGGAITSSPSGASGTSSTLVMTYTVSGADFSAEEAGATSVSFDFTVTYSANNSDLIAHTAGGNVGITNTQVGGSEVLTITVSDAMNISGFGGTISLDGIVSAQLANFANDPEQQNLLLSDGSSIDLVGNSDTTGATTTGDTALIAAALGITGFDQSGVAGNAGFRTLRTQFTAVPEPSSVAMIGVCGLGLLIRRRR